MQLAAIVHFINALGHATEEALIVHFLEDAAGAFFTRHLTDEKNDGQAILIGHVNGNRSVGGTRPAAHHEYRRLTCQLGFTAGHEARATFMAANDDFDAAGMQ